MMDGGPTKTLLRALAGHRASRPPIWLMRQAGRYLPEYRATREQAGGFLDLCYTPDLATEVTLQPIRRYGFDAAILFADILLVPHAMGQKLWFEVGEGPRLTPIADAAAIDGLDTGPVVQQRLSPVFDTVARLRDALPDAVTLIGFAGAPWTVATYMVAGRGKEEQSAARALIDRDRGLFTALIDRLTDATIDYALAQIDAGAEAFKIFDTWASAFVDDPSNLEAWVIAPAKRIVDAIRTQRPGVPVLYFPRAVGDRYPEVAKAVAPDGLAIDHGTSMAWAAEVIPDGITLQGNLDPACLATRVEALEAETRAILEAAADRAFIFNLGHGITPDADPEAVARLVAMVRGGVSGA